MSRSEAAGARRPAPIIAGDDGREGGTDALALAYLLAAPAHREVITVAAQPGSAVEELNAQAIEGGAEAIAIGSSHRGGFGRVLPGAVGNDLLRSAPCALAIAPAGFASSFVQGFNLIGVAYDGSDESKLALERAINLAVAFDAGLRLMTVADDPQLVGAHWAGVAPVATLDDEQLERRRERIETELAGALETVPASTQAFGETLKGHPAGGLIEATEGLDLLLLGSRGYGPLKRVLVGGVSGPVTRAAHCPVIVTPRSALATGAPVAPRVASGRS